MGAGKGAGSQMEKEIAGLVGDVTWQPLGRNAWHLSVDPFWSDLLSSTHV